MGKKSRLKKDLSRQADIEVRKANQLDRKGDYYVNTTRENTKGNTVIELKSVEYTRKLQLKGEATVAEGFGVFLDKLYQNYMTIILNGLHKMPSQNGSVKSDIKE